MIKLFEEYTDVLKNQFEKNKERFKVGEYAIMTSFNNMKVKILKVSKYNTIWVENEDGNVAEWKTNGIVPEIEFNSNKYNI
jgi:ribosomal protein S17E